jgi:hypothetical protein
MSAKLLSEPHSNQGIEDDRESAFYVLLYLGLLYTKHNQISQKLDTYLEIFDYTTVANNVAEGGDLKSNFLVTHGRADALKFDCHPMNDLIDDLRTNFSVRYEAPPSEAVLANYEELKRNPNVIASALLYHPAALYETRRNTLQERGWLVETISKYLDDPDVWTMDNAANINLVSKKRKRQETAQNSGVKSKKSNINKSSSKLVL